MPTDVKELRDLLMEINGGEVSGENLFHSFDKFSIPEGAEAVFQNADSIENIFARVTGDSMSEIFGTLSTQGDANLFLMNPNGIVFGEDATLNVGGSFIGTTADGILFEDGNEFAATDDGSDPVLSVEVPIGLGFGSNPGPITVNGNGNQITPNFSSNPTTVEESETSLSVNPGNTLGLIGGEITTDGATIDASGGKIELASIGSGVVELQTTDDGFAFGYDDVTNFQNTTIDNLSVLNASGSGGGNISLNAANVAIEDGSLLLIQNEGNTPSGTIDINAAESLTLSGVSPDGEISSYIRSETTGSGEGANIAITTQELTLQNAARVNSIAYAEGASGNITIDASDSVQFLENTLVNSDRQYTTSNITTASYESGDTGSVRLATPKLEMTNASAMGAAAIGTGKGGDVTLNTDTIRISGINNLNPDQPSSSGISSSSNAGDAGDLTINTSQLQISDGARVTALTFGTGNAGEVKINASESIDVSGDSTSISSEVSPVADEAARTRAGTPLVPSGRGGDVILTTSELNITNGGEISVANRGSGDSGRLSIKADDFSLYDASSITAASASGQGGDINLDTDNLQIDSNSSITAEAGQQGDGGNININASNIFAKKSSAVTADAEGGDGGNLTIEAINILLEAPVEDIFTASSELGIDGSIEIETDGNFEGSFDLVKPDFAVAERALENSCLAQRNKRKSTFVYGGTGGLPVSPDNMVTEERSYSTRLRQVEPGLAQPNPLETNSPPQSNAGEVEPIVVEPESEWQIGDPIMEANVMIHHKDGGWSLVHKNKETGEIVCPQ